MLIIGCDFHPSFQQISFVDQETGEYGNLRLDHKKGEAEKYYRSLAGRQVLVGWKPPAGCAGSSACCGSWEWSCGWPMR